MAILLQNWWMNRIMVVFALSGILIVSCNPANKKSTTTEQDSASGVAKFVFSEEIHNFGTLKAGEVVSFTFSFKNEGTKPLIINHADAGCNCTKVKLPELPVMPGENGLIEVIYDSAGEVGRQLKAITLHTNAEPAEIQLYIKAEVTNDVIEINS